MAVNRQDISAGDVFYYDESLQMTNFHSKELDRNFEEIYFVNQISKTPVFNHPAAGMPGMGHRNENAHSGRSSSGKADDIRMNKSPGETTIANIFDNRNEFSGKEVEIRGVVVKINKEIMGRNWIHIQDGTETNGHFDLTITTTNLAEVNDEVSFKGKITLNKDFGAGYFYELIMEDALLVNNTSAKR